MATELILDEEMTWKGGRDEIRKDMDESVDMLRHLHFIVKYGDNTLPGSINRFYAPFLEKGCFSPFARDPAQMNLLYERPCEILGFDGVCQGLDTVLICFARDAKELTNLADHELSFNTPQYLSVEFGRNV